MLKFSFYETLYLSDRINKFAFYKKFFKLVQDFKKTVIQILKFFSFDCPDIWIFSKKTYKA